MFQYCLGHTEVNWTKSNRMTHDNQGIDPGKVASHNSRFGCRTLNKKHVTMFPFAYEPMQGAHASRLLEPRHPALWPRPRG